MAVKKKSLEFPGEVWVKHNYYDQPYVIGQSAVALGWTEGARRYVPEDEFRQQVADLILLDARGRQMDIVGPLEHDGGKMCFDIGHGDTGQRFRVRIEMEEI